mmetsp:Transcript_13762/g.35163  ORF Transcript_13762/g.35163 Transcript_13762/m.35163 type:complete len:354 (-) Transcript_13762:196-1257(-)
MVAVDGSGLGHLRAASPVRRNRTDRATLRRAHRLARLLAHSSGCARAAATAEWGAVGSLPQVGVPAHYARAQDQVSRRAETSRLARLCDRARTQVAASTHLRSAVRCARGEQPPSGGGGSTPQRRGSAAQQDEGVLKFLSSSGSALLAAEFSEQRTAFFFELLRGLFAPRRSHAAEQESLVRRLSLPDGQLLLPNYPAMPVTRLVCSQQALAESSDALAEFIESISSPHLLGGKPRGAQVDIDQVLDVALSAFSQAAQEIRALLLRTFYTFDTNRDGVLSIAEFGELCGALHPGTSQSQIELLFLKTQEASEKLVLENGEKDVGDALLPEAFVATMLSAADMLSPQDRSAADV